MPNTNTGEKERDEIYRKVERLLNGFKNGRIGYSLFIESINSILDSKIKEVESHTIKQTVEKCVEIIKKNELREVCKILLDSLNQTQEKQ